MSCPRVLPFFLILFATLTTPATLLAEVSKERAAVAVAESWLRLVDTARYADSWKEAASLFQEMVPLKQWEGLVSSSRRPLGRVQSRELLGTKATKSLPDAPEGEYVVIQFRTTFENKPGALETVTPMLDVDGKWRVSGYYIR